MPIPYQHIEKYREKLRKLIEFSGSDNELSIRPTFQGRLSAYCSEQRESLMLVPELATPRRKRRCHPPFSPRSSC